MLLPLGIMENALRANPLAVKEQYERQISKLCQWLGIPRRTVYYKSVKTVAKVNPELAGPIKVMTEESPSFGYRTVAYLLGMNKNTAQRVFQLKGW